MTRYCFAGRFTTEAALAALFAIVDKVRPPESATALLLSIAAVIIAEAMAEEAPATAAAEVINGTWARRRQRQRL